MSGEPLELENEAEVNERRSFTELHIEQLGDLLKLYGLEESDGPGRRNAVAAAQVRARVRTLEGRAPPCPLGCFFREPEFSVLIVVTPYIPYIIADP